MGFGNRPCPISERWIIKDRWNENHRRWRWRRGRRKQPFPHLDIPPAPGSRLPAPGFTSRSLDLWFLKLWFLGFYHLLRKLLNHCPSIWTFCKTLLFVIINKITGNNMQLNIYAIKCFFFWKRLGYSAYSWFLTHPPLWVQDSIVEFN